MPTGTRKPLVTYVLPHRPLGQTRPVADGLVEGVGKHGRCGEAVAVDADALGEGRKDRNVRSMPKTSQVRVICFGERRMLSFSSTRRERNVPILQGMNRTRISEIHSRASSDPPNDLLRNA